MVGASEPTKVIQEPCLNVPKPAARYQKRVGAQKLQTAPPPVTLPPPPPAFSSAVSLAARLLYNTMPVNRSRLPPAPQVEVACSLWRRPVPWTRARNGGRRGQGYPAGPGPANGHSILLLISFVRPGVPGSTGFLAAVFCAPFFGSALG